VIPADTPIGTKAYIYQDDHECPYAWIGETTVISDGKGGITIDYPYPWAVDPSLSKAEIALKVMEWAIGTVQDGVKQIEEMRAIIAGEAK
jgi:hypothetical protein